MDNSRFSEFNSTSMILLKSCISSRSALLIGAALVLSACGGGSGGGGTVASNAPSAVYRMAAAAPTTACPAGGIVVNSGIDTNANGVLDASEITSTQSVCNGVSGVSTLIATAVEPVNSTNCPSGGTKIMAGQDVNANNTLDSTEVQSTAYVCNGATGAQGLQGTVGPVGISGPAGPAGPQGAPGTNGYNSLMAVVAELPGSNCTYGGTRITSGLDLNRNSSLDSTEVTSTTYTCNGAGINWVDVAGTTFQAVSNTGYMADNASQVVVITLPAAPAVGDIVQVDGIGAGGWRVSANANQWISTRYISATPIALTISGTQRESISLQYAGNNVFNVLNYVGTNPTTSVTLPTGYVSQGGIVWTPVSITNFQYSSAASYCSSVISGVSGWNLPALSELQSMGISGLFGTSAWNPSASTVWTSNTDYYFIFPSTFLHTVSNQNFDVTCVYR